MTKKKTKSVKKAEKKATEESFDEYCERLRLEEEEFLDYMKEWTGDAPF